MDPLRNSNFFFSVARLSCYANAVITPQTPYYLRRSRNLRGYKQKKVKSIKSFIVLVVLRRSVQRVFGAHLRVIAPRQHSHRRSQGCPGPSAAAMGSHGVVPPNDCLCPPFRSTLNTFLEHHVATRQQTIMKKEIMTFKHKSR